MPVAILLLCALLLCAMVWIRCLLLHARETEALLHPNLVITLKGLPRLWVTCLQKLPILLLEQAPFNESTGHPRIIRLNLPDRLSFICRAGERGLVHLGRVLLRIRNLPTTLLNLWLDTAGVESIQQPQPRRLSVL